MSREDGFTLSELLVSTTIMLLATGAALTTFRQGLMINDSAAQIGDTNQNLRAGTNQLMRDLMMAGRIIGPEGIPMPSGAGVQAFNRPGPTGSNLTFSLIVDTDTTLNLPSISSGYELGPMINGSKTDVVTILTVDEFMPILQSKSSGSLAANEGKISATGADITLPTNSQWLVADTTNDTQPINVGDLVLFKNPNGMAIQAITSKDATHVYFANTDWFKFNQLTAPQVPILLMNAPTQLTSMFRVLMITYYVDNVTTPGTPRLTRVLNHYTPQALAGVVEDLDLTYDLVDGIYNPTKIPSLPYTDVAHSVTYNANQIRKVNIHMGVRSEQFSKPAQDYVRNHITTAVDARSLASVDRYQ
jgi:hypothetical protein